MKIGLFLPLFNWFICFQLMNKVAEIVMDLFDSS